MFNQPLFTNGEMPDCVKPNNVLKFIDGILNISIPKDAKTLVKKTIEIK